MTSVPGSSVLFCLKRDKGLMRVKHYLTVYKSIGLCWDPAPAGSRGTLRMNSVGE